MYTDIIAKKILNGIEHTPVSLADDELQVEYNVVYTKKSISAYYVIKMLPKYVPRAMYQLMRNAVIANSPSIYTGVNFKQILVPHEIDWTSSEMKDRQRVFQLWEKELDKDSEEFQDKGADDEKYFQAWRRDSWKYIQRQEVNFNKLINMETVVELYVLGTNKQSREQLEKSCKNFENLCSNPDYSVKYSRVNSILTDLLEYLSPTTHNINNKASRTISNRILDTSIFSKLTSYAPGVLPTGEIFMGIDISTGNPVYKDFIRSHGQAENIGILGETGSGKSVISKDVLLHFRFARYNQIILDAEGEYKKIVTECGGVNLDISKGTGLYFDTIEIGEPTGIPEIDASLYHEARLATLGFFNTLANPLKGMTDVELKLFNDAYDALLQTIGIKENDSSTWKLSSQLSVKHIYEVLKLMKSTDYPSELRIFIDKLAKFFEPTGIYSYMFKQRVSLQDIITHSDGKPTLLNIILNLDSDDKFNAEKDFESVLKQTTALYLVILLSNYFKSLRQFTTLYIEEYQRYRSAGLQQLVVLATTGNRKRNVITVILSNAPRVLLGSDKEFAKAVADNINTVYIGKIKSKAVDLVAEAFGLENCVDILNTLSNDEKYQHTFLLKMDGGQTTLVKHFIPQHIIRSGLFESRDTKKK